MKSRSNGEASMLIIKPIYGIEPKPITMASKMKITISQAKYLPQPILPIIPKISLIEKALEKLPVLAMWVIAMDKNMKKKNAKTRGNRKVKPKPVNNA